MLTAAYLLNVLGMILLPIVLAFYVTRKFSLSWKLILAGALLTMGFQTGLVAILADLIAANRKLLEEIRFMQRRGEQPSLSGTDLQPSARAKKESSI